MSQASTRKPRKASSSASSSASSGASSGASSSAIENRYSGVVQTASIIGKRARNEDQHDVVLEAQQQYFAVFDGHGGKDVAIIVKDMFRAKVARDYNPKLTKAQVHRRFRAICDEVQAELLQKHAKKAARMGTCALVCALTSKYIVCMNVGDSRAVLCNKYNIAVPLTKDHRPLSFEESSRIRSANGTVITSRGDDPRINGLSVSRTFGDLDARPEVVHLPDIYFHDRSSHDRFLLLGCDGLWESMTPQDAVDFILTASTGKTLSAQHDTTNQKNIAHSLAKEAVARGSGDNITCIIYWF